MDLGIRDRAAIVAASSRGLGRAVAEALASEGANVAVCSRDAAATEAAVRTIREQYGVKAFGQAVDVTDETAVRNFVAAAREALGPIEICVTNCGGPPAGRFEDFGPDDWRRAFELCFLSALYLIRETLPDMKRRKWGRVVSITSVSVKQPLDNLILSNGVRGALVGLMKSLSNEYGGGNVLFNNIGPSLTATERLLTLAGERARREGRGRDEVIAEMAAGTALGRVARPEEFAAVAAFLCSEKASYLTGGSLMVDGGLIKGI